MNKKEAVAYAQITLGYMQSSKYKGVLNPDTFGLEMKQAFKLYPRDVAIEVAGVQTYCRKKLQKLKNGCDENE